MGEMVNRLLQVRLDAANVRMTGTYDTLKARGLVIGAPTNDNNNTFHTGCIKNLHEQPIVARAKFVSARGRETTVVLAVTVHFSSQTGMTIDRAS